MPESASSSPLCQRRSDNDEHGPAGRQVVAPTLANSGSGEAGGPGPGDDETLGQQTASCRSDAGKRCFGDAGVPGSSDDEGPRPTGRQFVATTLAKHVHIDEGALAGPPVSCSGRDVIRRPIRDFTALRVHETRR